LDYHHFHYPVGGVAGETHPIKGPLYSVNPVSLRRSIRPLMTNYRCLSLIRSSHTGLVCFIEVGATNVGSIHHRPLPATRRIQKGDPKGWFEFGGSSVISLFEPGMLKLSRDLKDCSRDGIELYARMGDSLGQAG
jgi:phosphatidylserine decarboxylase